jgi:hypothetical protein
MQTHLAVNFVIPDYLQLSAILIETSEYRSTVQILQACGISLS